VTYPLTAIISDLHGNVPALEKALADARERGVERYVCLGDVVGYGAQPRECLERVMELCRPAPEQAEVDADGELDLSVGLCLRGNHEEALLGSANDFNPRARAAIDWTREELNRGDRASKFALWDYLDALKPSRHEGDVMFAHGSPRDPVREYMMPRDIEDEEKLTSCFEHMSGNICFVGHSHVPAIYRDDRRIYLPEGSSSPIDLDGHRCIVNVGSVGQPRDGDARLSYAVFDGRRVEFVRLDYDHERAAAEIRAVPELPDHLADRLAVGR